MTETYLLVALALFAAYLGDWCRPPGASPGLRVLAALVLAALWPLSLAALAVGAAAHLRRTWR